MVFLNIDMVIIHIEVVELTGSSIILHSGFNVSMYNYFLSTDALLAYLIGNQVGKVTPKSRSRSFSLINMWVVYFLKTLFC